MGSHNNNNTFPADFVMNATLYIYTQKEPYLSKQIKKMINRFNMAAKLPIFISHHFNFCKNFKNYFPKGIFNEIWLIIRDYECIYNTEIKTEKKFTPVRF